MRVRQRELHGGEGGDSARGWGRAREEPEKEGQEEEEEVAREPEVVVPLWGWRVSCGERARTQIAGAREFGGMWKWFEQRGVRSGDT